MCVLICGRWDRCTGEGTETDRCVAEARGGCGAAAGGGDDQRGLEDDDVGYGSLWGGICAG